MAFQPDYPGAIVVQARNYGYVVGGKHLTNNPKAFCLHTPEEPPDNVPATPYYFASTDRDASTTYFVSYLGFVFQMVPESEGAYGNAVEGKPYPAWANSAVNLNLQTLSVEIEGYAATIHQTMPRGSPQWKALVNLMAHRCKALNIPPGRTFGHYEVSVYRSDPGQLNIPQVVADVITAMQPAQEEDDMPFPPPHYHSDTEGAVMLIGLLKHPLNSDGHATAHALGSADLGPVDVSGLQYLAKALSDSFPSLSAPTPSLTTTSVNIPAIAGASAKATRELFRTDPPK